VENIALSYNSQLFEDSTGQGPVLNTFRISIEKVAAELNAEFSGESLVAVTDVTDVTHDSRQARKGTLFVAVKGVTALSATLCVAVQPG
jgi:acetylglutamate kinase